MIATARRHHYLPQAYLAGFTNSGRKDGRIHVYEVEGGRWFPTVPAKIAVERDFNVIDSEEHPPDALENALSQFETSLAEALLGIRASPKFPNAEDLNYALNLLSLVSIRNPRVRGRTESTRKQTAMIIGDLVVSSPAMYENVIRKARAAGYVTGPEIPFEQARAFHLDPSRYTIEVPIPSHHQREFRAQHRILMSLAQRQWSLLVAPPDAKFITCDHPVTLAPTAPGGPPNLTFTTPNTAVLFPLSVNLALHGSLGNGRLDQVLELRRDQVAQANAQTIHNARRQVYSCSGSLDTSLRGVVHTINSSTTTA